MLLAMAGGDSANAASCQSFADLRVTIDGLIKTNPETSAVFRREVGSGADSLYTLEQLADAATGAKIDVCRFEVVEYLTKLGFPPGH
jgi:hypothetical protein